MSANGHDWIVFHRVRFAFPLDGVGRPLPGPKRALAWRFYPNSPLGPDGLPTCVSDEWGGFGIYATRADSEDVLAHPEEHLPFLGDTVEAFHALAVPFAHRGAADWRGTLLQDATFIVSPFDPGGPLMVLTSAGYVNPGPGDLPRITLFVRELRQILAWFATLPGNTRRAVFSGPRVDGHDGMTVSLWRSDEDMMAAAYRPGQHRTQLDYDRKVGHIDRSSFTRTRILSTRGTWDGSDPVQGLARHSAASPPAVAGAV
jgi:hypothetical protein